MVETRRLGFGCGLCVLLLPGAWPGTSWATGAVYLLLPLLRYYGGNDFLDTLFNVREYRHLSKCLVTRNLKIPLGEKQHLWESRRARDPTEMSGQVPTSPQMAQK